VIGHPSDFAEWTGTGCRGIRQTAAAMIQFAQSRDDEERATAPRAARKARGMAMQRTAASFVPAWLARSAVALGLSVAAIPASAQQPAPTLPTIPAPGVPVTAHQPAPKAAEPAKEDLPELTLGECIALAVERQPALRAVRASQDATGAGQSALNNIGRIGALLSPDLPIRREQSNRGVVAAAADVQKLHNEVVHDVTRLYYTVVYARQQEQLASDVVAQIEAFKDIAEKLLNSATPGEMTKAKLDLMIIGLARSRRLHSTARTGVQQAEAALREVMGVQDGSIRFRVKDKELPIMAQNINLTRDQVVEMALCRRPELALAAAAADAFRLEVYAQGQLRFRRSVPTLASASDIHSRLLPTASRDPGQDYRPEPIAPEMPPQVVGNKNDRVTRVLAYSHRADAVYDKARNLMILEAENTFLKFEDASRQMAATKDAFAAAKDLMERTREGFDNPKAPKDQLLLGYAQAAEAQAAYVESVNNYILALAALERVTAGGVKPAFPGR
jgi:outer membrane protein TolC